MLMLSSIASIAIARTLRSIAKFEAVARALARLPSTEPATEPTEEKPLHPFDSRNIHPNLPPKVKLLFDDGHYPEATLHAFKYLDKLVERHSGIRESGFKLMMAAFEEAKPKLQLTPLITISEIDEQAGYRFVFAGGFKAIRNPRGHEFAVVDNPDICLDHLSFVSMLLRRLEQSGYS
jgi:uncharacterized protein (TIGR02391 family)